MYGASDARILSVGWLSEIGSKAQGKSTTLDFHRRERNAGKGEWKEMAFPMYSGKFFGFSLFYWGRSDIAFET